MCNFSPQISKTFFLFIKYSQRHLFHYLVLKRKLYKKKELGTLSQYFLNLSSWITLMRDQFILVLHMWRYCQVKLLSLFHSLGKREHLVCFWRSMQTVKLFALWGYWQYPHGDKGSCNSWRWGSYSPSILVVLQTVCPTTLQGMCSDM